MKERRSLHHLADSDVQTFLEREENQNADRKTEKYVFGDFGDGIFSRMRTKIHNWKICHRPILACIRKFCILKIMPMVCFCSVPKHFSCGTLAPTYFTILIRRLSIVLFSLINKVDLTKVVRKGLLCLYDKQNNTLLLVDIEFLFPCSTRHLTPSLRSLVSYRVEHSKRNSTSTRVHVLFSI